MATPAFNRVINMEPRSVLIRMQGNPLQKNWRIAMLRRLILVLLSVFTLSMVFGCSSSTDEGDPELTGAQQFEAMYNAAVDYMTTTSPKVVLPATISANLVSDPNYYTVLDTRSEADFTAGHITGAYNVDPTTVLDDIEDIPNFGTKPIIVSCYSGQTAGWVTAALNIMGYDASSMGWAHSGFRHELDKWTSHIGNLLTDGYGGYFPETENQNGNLVEFDYPTLDLGLTNAGDVAEARIREVLSWGFGSHAIEYQAMVDDPNYPEDYFILNYFTEAQYEGTDAANMTAGHIPGAFQFTPKKSLVIGTSGGEGWEDMLKNVPLDKKVVVYCWTSQNSSQVAFYLNLLGYDAYSLKWGSNQLFHDVLNAHKWVPEDHADDAYEPWTTP